MKVSTKELEEKAYYYLGNEAGGNAGKDDMIRRRGELMYSYLDYDNDRSRVRNRYLEEANKRTTLKEIGEMLD